MNVPLELRRTKKGPPLVVLFGAVLSEEGLSAPSLVALQPIRAGTHLQFEGHKFRIDRLEQGTQRPDGGFSFKRIT